MTATGALQQVAQLVDHLAVLLDLRQQSVSTVPVRDIYLKEFHGLEDSRVVWLLVIDVLIFMITARLYWTGFGFQVYVLLSILFAHSRGIEAYLGSEVVVG